MDADLEAAAQSAHVQQLADGSFAVEPMVSTLHADIPIASDAFTKDQYTSSVGSVRLGKLLEDLDALAVNAAFKHCWAAARSECASQPPEALHLVTACVDRIDIVRPLPRCDLRMVAFVSWTGASSVEVTVQLREATADAQSPPLLQAAVVMVRLDPTTRKAAMVPQLSLEGASASVLSAFQAGAAARQVRQADRAGALEKVAPLPEELQAMHHLMNASRRAMQDAGVPDAAQVQRLPRAVLWGGKAQPAASSLGSTLPVVAMGQTLTQNVFTTQPQDRNTAGAVFGGLLMRRAYELAQATALQFLLASCSRQDAQEADTAVPIPRLMAVDDIAFVRPVQVGHLLQVAAQVVATQDAAAQVAVTCHTVDTRNPRAAPVHTNSFHFTFACVHEDSSGAVQPARPLAAVLPDTYAQVMAQIDGKRRLSQAAAQAATLDSAYACALAQHPAGSVGFGDMS